MNGFFYGRFYATFLCFLAFNVQKWQLFPILHLLSVDNAAGDKTVSYVEYGRLTARDRARRLGKMHLCSALRVENNPCRDAGRLVSVLDSEGVFCRLCGGLDRRKYDAPYAEIAALAGVKRKGDPIRYRVYFRYKCTRTEGYSESLTLTYRIADNTSVAAENSSLLVNEVALLALSGAGFDKGGVIIVGDKAYLLAVGSVPGNQVLLAGFLSDLALGHLG